MVNKYSPESSQHRSRCPQNDLPADWRRNRFFL